MTSRDHQVDDDMWDLAEEPNRAKTHGWDTHSDSQGRITLVAMNSGHYDQPIADSDTMKTHIMGLPPR